MRLVKRAVVDDVIELFPTYDDFAYRIELFGDEIDSLRRFDPITQRSEGDHRLFGMGTTLTVAYSVGVDLFIIGTPSATEQDLASRLVTQIAAMVKSGRSKRWRSRSSGSRSRIIAGRCPRSRAD